MRALVVLVMLSACRPGPGETRCTTTDVYGTMMTNCKSGPPLRHEDDERPAPAAPQPAVFWCATRASDGFGYCENLRGSMFAPCEYRAHAICASSGCFTTPESCAKAERLGKRSASACALRR